jgi:transposase
MPKIINIEITESEEKLKYLLRKQTKPLQQDRLRALLLIKQGKVRYTGEIATKLRRQRKTIYNWLQSYENNGIESYLQVLSRGYRKEKLSQETKELIAEKLSDPYTDITSYVELLQWVEENCQKDVPYYVLYNYCRKNLNSKLKVSRKSHHKKDEQSVQDFKKNTRAD